MAVVTGRVGALAALCVLAALGTGCTALPRYVPVESVTYPDQNWTEAQRRWFYHSSQGTKLMPRSWFLALEQPEPGLTGAPRFSRPEHLARFGFIPDAASPENPDGLPVGFALDDGFRDDDGTTPETVVGLTCAACHTGQVEYRGRGIRIDGGPAMTDTAAFQQRLGIALLLTYNSEPRFARFARRVLASEAAPGGGAAERDTEAARAALHARLGRALQAGQAEASVARRENLYPLAEGFGRLDALGRGGNFVFGTVLGEPRNFAVADAPVSYPALWDAPWFDWVQYNGAIRQPLGRNVAEAMGVRSIVKLSGPVDQLYVSTVRIANIHAMEQLLAGPSPGAGLRSPRWPEEILGAIDRAAAARGEAHYRQLCAGCHEARPVMAVEPGGGGLRPELRVTMVPLQRIGTDPKAAMNFVERRAYLARGDAAQVSAAEGLQRVTTAVIQRWYRDNAVPPERQREIDGFRENAWRAPAAYRARPLNGIWATAPYLHNGAVPSLYQMLLPAERRDAAFFVGGREFDPRQVGFTTGEFEGGFRFDTALPGNSNRGHEFRDDRPRGEGVIGPGLTDQQRWELVEYLKTL